MAITLVGEDLSEMFHRQEGAKILVNDINFFGEEATEFSGSLFTVYDGDIMSTVPRCDCGNMTGAYRLGKICNSCGTKVSDIYHNKDPLLWMKTIDENIKFINPDYWKMFKTTLSMKDIDWVRWMGDSRYNPANVKIPPHIYGVLEVLGERNYFNLTNKLPDILTYFQNVAKYKDPDRQISLQHLKDMYYKEPNKVFTTYIPIVNKKLFVMENTPKGKFINLSVSDVIDIVMQWIKVCNDVKNAVMSEEKRKTMIARETINILSKLAAQYQGYNSKYLAFKSGAFRKHVYGARSHFTFRTVIVAIAGPHNYNEIHVPWVVGVTVFKPHLLNKLVTKYGYTFKDANTKLWRAIKNYDPFIDKLLDELISESPYSGIPVIEQRN